MEKLRGTRLVVDGTGVAMVIDKEGELLRIETGFGAQVRLTKYGRSKQASVRVTSANLYREFGQVSLAFYIVELGESFVVLKWRVPPPAAATEIPAPFEIEELFSIAGVARAGGVNESVVLRMLVYQRLKPDFLLRRPGAAEPQLIFRKAAIEKVRGSQRA